MPKRSQKDDGPIIKTTSVSIRGLTRTYEKHARTDEGVARVVFEEPVVAHDIETRQESRRSPKTQWFRGARIA